MFSMNQARYSTVIFLRGLCKFASLQFQRPPPLANFPSQKTALNFEKTFQKPATNIHHFTLKNSLHIHWKFTEKLYTGTGTLRIRKHTAEVDYDFPSSKLYILFRRPQYKETLRSRCISFRLHEQPTALSRYLLYFVVAIATTN